MSKGKPGYHHDRQCAHPRREARRRAAAERQAAHTCGPTCKRFRKAAAKEEAA